MDSVYSRLGSQSRVFTTQSSNVSFPYGYYFGSNWVNYAEEWFANLENIVCVCVVDFLEDMVMDIV